MAGHWPLPTRYGITTAYGLKGNLWKGCGFHTGIDLFCPIGTPIYAPEDGDIRYRDYGTKAYGDRAFALSPDAAHEWFFAHCETRLPAGTRVKRGQQIGTTGNRGNSTGPHLHVEYHVAKSWDCRGMRDPAPLLDRANVAPTTPPAKVAGPYVTSAIYSDKLGFGEPTNGDASSDTVKELQRRLNEISLAGGAELVVDGRYGESTDAEVRKWQEQICHDPSDPVLHSYLGPAQRSRMFPVPTYTITDHGLPAIARGGGGNPSVPSGVAPVPPVSTRPGAPALMLPGAEWDPIEKTGGGYFTGLRAFSGTAKKCTLHTTETNVKPNWQAQQFGIPHATVNLKSGQSWQHLPFDIAAYTLKGGEHSPNSESGTNIQLEIIGWAKDSANWSDEEYDNLQKILLWISVKLGVPYVFPVRFPPQNRLSWDEWEMVSGFLGHSMIPFNDHTDPGALDVSRLTTAAVEPEPEPEPEPAPESGMDAALRGLLVMALRRLADEIDRL